jgi:protocatechuate 3,4-dioxygenase beta subunit
MNPFDCPICHRRGFLLGALAGSAAFFTAPGAFAEALTMTPRSTEGPFYPDEMPLDTDNDLLILNDSITPAVGEVTYLSGRLFNHTGAPVRNALVEIWQCCANGAYTHTKSGQRDKLDANFQGYGRYLTDGEGRYFFRTIKPVSYPGRTPHIHFAVGIKDKRMLTTQLYVEGEPQNERDGLLRRVKDKKQRELVIRPFTAVEGSTTGELQTDFDIYLGKTPEDPKEDRFRGGGSRRRR